MSKERNPKKSTASEPCGPSEEDASAARELLSRIGDKWSVLIIVSLAKSPQHRARFSALERMIPGISQRMLSATLRSLERDGLLIREFFPEIPPRVEYELTPLGYSLLNTLQGLVDWVSDNWIQVKAARESFDSDK